MRAPSSDPLADIPFVAETLARIKGMFLEMPGTEWTVAEGARLAGLESSVCHALFDALEQIGFLSRRTNGGTVRYLALLVQQPTDPTNTPSVVANWLQERIAAPTGRRAARGRRAGERRTALTRA
jgi:hypothetical protein